MVNRTLHLEPARTPRYNWAFGQGFRLSQIPCGSRHASRNGTFLLPGSYL